MREPQRHFAQLPYGRGRHDAGYFLQLHPQQFKRTLRRSLVLGPKSFVDQRRPAFDRVGLKAGRSDWNDAERKDEEDLASKSVHVTTRLSPEPKFEQSKIAVAGTIRLMKLRRM